MIRRKHKKKVAWVETRDLTQQAIYIRDSSAAGNITDQTLFFPLLTDGSAPDRADMTFNPASAEALGVSNWGTAIGELYQHGWQMQRLVGKIRFALQQRIGYGTLGASAAAANVMVRAGIFVGEVNETGSLLNGGDFQLNSDTGVGGPLTASSTWKDRRWLWYREWMLSNHFANKQSSGFGGVGAAIFGGQGGFLNPADLPTVVWGHTSTEMYHSVRCNSDFDIKPRCSLGDNQRLWWAFTAWDPAFGPEATTTSGFNLLFMKQCRALVSRSNRRSR